MEALKREQDLRALYAAVQSERSALSKLVLNRGYRKRRLVNVIERIRSLRVALAQAVRELLLIRGATNGMIDQQIAKYDARLAELRVAIVHAEQRSRIERLLKIQAQMAELGMELPAAALAEVGIDFTKPFDPTDDAYTGDPDEISEDVILS